MSQTDDRYTSRLRPMTESIPLDIGGGNEVGVWDTVEKHFVKRNPVTHEWEPET